MKLKVIILLLLLSSAPILLPTAQSNEVSQANEIVLLTSLDSLRIPPPSYFPAWLQRAMSALLQVAPSQFEETFRSYYQGQQVVLRVVHRATQFDLWTALHSERSLGVIWISHSHPGYGAGLLRVPPAILDADGFDVTPAIDGFSARLRFFAVIGCFAGVAIEHQVLKQNLRFEKTRLFTNLEVADGPRDFRRALAWSAEVLQSNPVANSVSAPRVNISTSAARIALRLTRLIPRNLSPATTAPALRIQDRRARILGMFPQGHGGELQSVDIVYPLPNLRTPAIRAARLMIDAGLNGILGESDFVMGRIEVQMNDSELRNYA